MLIESPTRASVVGFLWASEDGQLRPKRVVPDRGAPTMKMGDGGFRPAYNVQFATDGGARVILGVDVTNSGSDR